jgi:hypothetical protein
MRDLTTASTPRRPKAVFPQVFGVILEVLWYCVSERIVFPKILPLSLMLPSKNTSLFKFKTTILNPPISRYRTYPPGTTRSNSPVSEGCCDLERTSCRILCFWVLFGFELGNTHSCCPPNSFGGRRYLGYRTRIPLG